MNDPEVSLPDVRDAAAILIAGPTASGKSAVALDIAERIGGTVINADSMQVYGELRILTARPEASEEARVPHLLYGHVPIREVYSVGRWLGDAAGALATVRAQGRVPVVTGGTGLYFRALTQGLSPVPDVPETVRTAVRNRLSREGAGCLHEELESRDPEAAGRIPPSDPQRLLRALEVLEATGRPISDWQREPAQPPLVDPRGARRLVLWPQRASLRERIDRRFGEMLEAGALEEASAVMAMDLDPALPGYRAHGLRPLIAHLKGQMSLDEAAERTRAETRQYAKRQFTWFRHQMADWERVEPARALESLGLGEGPSGHSSGAFAKGA